MTRFEEFAEQWLRTGDPLAAARALGMNGSDALLAAREWPNNLEVIVAKQELLQAHGPEYFLPTKHDQARAIWQRAQECGNADEYQKLQRLYAEIMGNLAPKRAEVSGNLQQAIVFEMITPAAVKPIIDITPEKKQLT